MELHIEYLTDSKGKQKAVVISQREWKNFQAEYTKLKNKLSILLGIQDALKEVQEIQSGKRKGKTLGNLLNEI